MSSIYNKYVIWYEIKCNRTEIITDRIKIREIIFLAHFCNTLVVMIGYLVVDWLLK